MAKYDNLLRLAEIIRDEKANKQNTATRVGGLLVEIINVLESLDAIDISVSDKGQHIWTVGNRHYLLTPYTEASTVVSTVYRKPVVRSVEYSGNVSNEGEAATVRSLSFTQEVVKTWSDGRETTSLESGSLSTSGVTVSYGLSGSKNGAAVSANGRVTANPAISGSKEVIAVITPEVTWHGQTSENSSIFAEVSQDAATISLSPSSKNIGSGETSFEISIVRSSGVVVTGLSVAQGVSATLNEAKTKVFVTVSENTTSEQRSLGVVVVTSLGGQTVMITQSAAAITSYSVSYNLVHATSSSTATSVPAGSAFEFTLAPANGYVIDKATVTHNGVAVTPVSGYTYKIPSVSGDVTIACEAVRDEIEIRTYTVSYVLNKVESSNSSSVATEGSTYSFSLSPVSGYAIDSVSVTHNGVAVSPTSGYNYTIPGVAGNIQVTATASEVVVPDYNVTYNLSNVTASTSVATVKQGESYTVTLTPESGYKIQSASVTHNGQLVVPTGSGYTYTVNSVSGNIVVTASAIEDVVVENAKLTILGKYDVNVSATQGDNTITTSGSYTSANGEELDVLTNTDIDVSVVTTIQGETIQGLQLNGNTTVSPFKITGDSVLAPKVKGNIAYIKYSGGTWAAQTNPTVKTDTNHYRTEIFPVIKDEPLTIKIPNHANETVKIRTWYCSPYGTYDSTNSGLLSIELDANGVGTINPLITGHMALHPAYASDGEATVFSESDLKAIEINYTTATSWGVPAFKWVQVLDLGGVSSATASTITWNQSAALYGKYMLTFSTTFYQIKVIDIDTMKVVATVKNPNTYHADLHANSTYFLTKKYDETDYYPMLITCFHGSTSDKCYIYRLVGTTATSFTLQKVCEWIFTNCTKLDQVAGDNVLYLAARALVANADYVGLWRVPMNWSDSSIYVDSEFDLLNMPNATKLINGFYERTGQDWTLIQQDGKDDILVNTYGPSTDFPTKHAGMVFHRVNATEGHLIGWLPTNRILNGYEHDGVVYAGNGILYCVLVNSSNAYLYKFQITIPE